MSLGKFDGGTPAPLSRNNSSQQIPEVGRMSKLNRLQSPSRALSPALSSTSFVTAESSAQSYTPSLQRAGRTMSAPVLSLDIPPSRSSFVIKHEEAIPEQDSESDVGSPQSSICQSPGWEQMTDTKKKKEKKAAAKERKDKAKADAKALTKALAKAKTEAKQAEKQRNKLSKPAPAPALAPLPTKRASRLSFMMSRSASAPLVPQIPELKPLELPPRPQLGEQELPRAPASSASWNTTQVTPAESTPSIISPSEFHPARVVNDGFIGGLKLRLAEEAYVQERYRRQSLTDDMRLKALQRADEGDEDEADSKERKPARESDTMSMRSAADGNSRRTSQQWDSIYEQAAKMMRPNNEPAQTDRNGRKPRQKSYPPNSYFPVEAGNPTSPRASSAQSHSHNPSRARTSEDWDAPRSESAFSRERPSLNTRETSVDRGCSRERDGSAQGRVRQKRKDDDVKLVPGPENKVKVAEKAPEDPSTRGRRMSFAASIKNATRTSSTDATSTIKSPGPTHQNGAVPPLGKLTEARPLLPKSYSTSATEVQSHVRQSSKGNLPTLKGFRNAAKSIFIRSPLASPNATSPPVLSPLETDSNLRVLPVSADQRRVKQDSASKSADAPMSKAERFFGQPITGEICESPRSVSSGKLSHRQGDGYHSHSATDSSEDYSNRSSNVTTPMASNSASYYDSLPKISDEDVVTDKPGLGSAEDSAFMMTNAAPPKQEQELEIPKTDDSAIRLTAPDGQDPDTSLTPTGLTRPPSLTRSTSNPELQQQQEDLSFLPPLRHQPLTKPTKDKTSHKAHRALPTSQTQERRHSKTGSLIKPEPLGPVVSQSMGPSPIPSQYLQNARNSMPRPLSRVMPAAEPMAKMFVVCCSCKYFHDMPSKIYGCMVRPESVVEDKDLGVSGVVSTSVRCPWCGHGMTTSCCAGYAAVVVLREKLH